MPQEDVRGPRCRRATPPTAGAMPAGREPLHTPLLHSSVFFVLLGLASGRCRRPELSCGQWLALSPGPSALTLGPGGRRGGPVSTQALRVRRAELCTRELHTGLPAVIACHLGDPGPSSVIFLWSVLYFLKAVETVGYLNKQAAVLNVNVPIYSPQENS